MKKLFILFSVFIASLQLMAIDVTFRVDMSQQTVSPNGVHVAGTFNSWNPAATLMTNSGNNIYTVVINLTAGTSYQYKFINGNAWGTDESVPAACGVPNGSGGYNRQVTGPATATVLDAVCFSQCGPCGTPVTLTLKVDMSQQTVSPNGVHVAGSFNGWSPSATTMTNVGSVYSATITVNSGSTQQYKFVNGNAWGTDETVPAACGVPNGSGGYNREVTLATTNLIVPTVCFSQCGPCSGALVDLTLSVDMTQQTVSPNGVHVAGTFNSWSTTATPLTNTSGNIYSVTLTGLPGGSVQDYKFINDNSWAGEEIVPEACGVPNGSGGFNRQVSLGTTNTTVPTVCFSQCAPCAAPVDLTLQVDMSQQTISPNGVHIGGTFNNWSAIANPMTSMGNGIYSATINVYGNTVHTFKFVNGDAWTEAEIVPVACGVPDGIGGYNRQVTVGTTNLVVNPVCFGQCGNCAPMVNLTLQVDMSMQTVSPAGVHVAGSFNAWNSSSTPMDAIGNGKYSVTLTLISDSAYQYKFINGDTWAGEEIVPELCGVPNGTGGFNREAEMGTSSVVLPAICFSDCDLCPVPHSVTFQVDMSTQTVSPDGVHIVGNFQGWDPAATPMLAMANNVFEYTAQIQPNTNVEYKFINSNTWAGEELVPEACGVSNGTGGFNRYFTMPLGDTLLALKCFASCDPCPGTNYVNVLFQVDMSDETVAAEGVHLTGSFQGWDPATTEMTLIGGGIYQKTMLITAGETHQYKFINGNTWLGEEVVPEACGVSNGVGGFNRELVVPEADTTLDLVCFSLCGICPVGIDEAPESTFTVYPNPAKTELHINVMQNLGFAEIILSDLKGKVVLAQYAENLRSGNDYKVIVNHLSNGFYILKIKHAQGITTQKVVINK